MKNRTLRAIIILVGLLVLNIEAAQAGITHKFKVLIAQELSGFQLLYMSGGLLTVSFLCYVIFTPAFKEKGKAATMPAYFKNYTRHDYGRRRLKVKKIADILRNPRSGNTSHY